MRGDRLTHWGEVTRRGPRMVRGNPMNRSNYRAASQRTGNATAAQLIAALTAENQRSEGFRFQCNSATNTPVPPAIMEPANTIRAQAG
jgi:hypothetical protein